MSFFALHFDELILKTIDQLVSEFWEVLANDTNKPGKSRQGLEIICVRVGNSAGVEKHSGNSSSGGFGQNTVVSLDELLGLFVNLICRHG